jgi:hypothetical protein
MFEVYAILDPRLPGFYDYEVITFQYEPFYIGKGSVQQRRKYKRKNKYAEGRIRNIKEANLEPIYVTLYTYTEEQQALSHEKILIRKIGRLDEQRGPLFNFTDGGEGVSGVKLSPHTLELRRKNTTKFWSSLSEQERKIIGQKSLQNRDKHNVLEGSRRASITKANKPQHIKADIESRRYKKWCDKMYNRTIEQNKIRSARCSEASKKQSIVFLKIEILKSSTDELKEGYIYDKCIADWRKLGIPRDVATTLWKANNTTKVATTRTGIHYRVISGSFKKPIYTPTSTTTL